MKSTDSICHIYATFRRRHLIKMPNATRILGKMLDELMGNHRNVNPNDKVGC